ncbi:MAG: alpha/beta hydrolase-fold protein [Candidatus Aenigmatarchaeota archaeon]
MAKKEELKPEETIALEKLLAQKGFRFTEQLNLEEGIIGKKLKIAPVRIGMPGERDEGIVFGPPKKDTKYPIDIIKVIYDKGSYYVALFSSKAGNKPITYKELEYIPLERENPEESERKLLPPAPERKLFPPASERKLLPPAPEYPQLPPGPEYPQLPPAPERKLLPPGPEQRLLPPHPEQPLLPPHPQPILLPPHPEPPQLPPWNPPLLPPHQEPPLLPPHEEPPQPPQRPMAKVIVDSFPSQDVHVKVEAKQKLPKSLTDEKIAEYLGGVPKTSFEVKATLKVAKRFSDVLRNPVAAMAPPPPALPPLAPIIVLINAFTLFITAPPAPPNRPAAVQYVNGELQTEGIADNRRRAALSNIIVDAYYELDADWHTLDEWRSAELRNGQPVPFGLQRVTQYLATRLQGQRAIRRNEMGRPGSPVTTNPRTFVGVQLNAGNLEYDNRTGLGIVDRNTYTEFYLDLPRGWYRFTADKDVERNEEIKKAAEEGKRPTFDRWEITRFDDLGTQREIYDIIQKAREEGGKESLNDERFVRSMRRGVVTYWDNVVEVFVHGRIKLVAYYSQDYERSEALKKQIEDERKAGVYKYQRGAATPTFRGAGSGVGGKLASALGMSGTRGRISRDVERRKLKQDPYMLAAINKGKRILNKYAKAQYSKLFDRINQDYAIRARELRTLRGRAIAARAQLRRILIQNARQAGIRNAFLRMNDQDTLNTAARLAAPDGALAGNVALRDSSQALELYLKARDAYFEDFKKDVESATTHLRTYLKGRSQTIATMLARRYRMTINSTDENELRTELDAYTDVLTEDFVNRGRTMTHALMRGLGNLSRGAETFGAFGENVLYNTVSFIFGPWTIMSVFALLQFFFVLTYVGYNLTYLWIFPLIGAAFTFILNFSDSFKPLDWVTHLSSGAVIGYSAMLLLIALGALNWSFMDTFWFWIIWAILGFLGIMQFYQTGGWKTVLQGGVIVLIFAYAALGPYSAYYQQALDQVKTPVEIAYRAVSNAISDVWLLATNPTAWYARQQLVNVRPEHPIDFPKGIEVTMLEALPPSVPGGMEFALTAVIKNDGSIKEPAKDIILSLGCNQWCDSNNAKPSESRNIISLGSGRSAYNITPVSGKMERGDAVSMNVRGFIALGQSGREGETRLADVLFNMSYRYSTSSSLFVEVMNQSEVNRRIQNNENIFKNVIAVTKSSPAQLSLNVGPQPLMANQRSLLLVSVSNTRDESKIFMPRGTKINITMPSSVGYGLQCGNSHVTNNPATEGKEVVEYTVPEDITVLPYEFRSIFAFLCDFTAADVDDVKTDLVTAEMPDYTFVLTKKKQIPITPQIGILFNPYESECNKCGQGAFERCTPDDCDRLTNIDSTKGQVGTCWYEFSDKPAGALPVSYLGYRCHACSSDMDCSRFLTKGDCEDESIRCNLACDWDSTAVSPKVIEVNEKLRGSSLDVTDGMCKEATVAAPTGPSAPVTLTGDIARRAIMAAKEAGVSKDESVIFLRLITQESQFRHCCQDPAHNTDKTGCVDSGLSCDNSRVLVSFDGTSTGAMQLNRNAHPVWYSASESGLCSQSRYKLDCNIKSAARCNGNTAYNLDCNVRMGIRYLISLKNIYGSRGINFRCGSVRTTYTGWDAALRAYVGTGCDTAHANYVGSVNSQDVSRFQAIIDDIYSSSDSRLITGNLVAGSANRAQFYSPSLGKNKFYNIYLPPSYNTNQNKRYPVVYLLNGLWGDENDWIEKGDIVNSFNNLLSQGKTSEMILVMPDGDNTAYENGCSGSWIFSCGDYENYIVKDLISEIDSKYHTIPDSGHRAIGGLSLGARGAMRLGFMHTDIFSSVAGHSGRYDYLIDEMTDADWQKVKNSGLSIYFDHSSNDLIPFYLSSSRQLDQVLTAKGIPHEYKEIDFPTIYSHDWPYWKQQIQVSLVKDCNRICVLA